MKNFFIILLAFTSFSLLASIPRPIKSKPITNTRPLFIENKGQVRGMDGKAAPDVQFVFDDTDTRVFLLECSLAYQFTRIHYPAGYSALNAPTKRTQDIERPEALSSQIRTETFRMDMTLTGANSKPRIIADGKSGDYLNYYQYDALAVHSFQKITYKDVYPGIDWVIHTDSKHIAYDFIVHPGADPSLIKLKISHHESLSLTDDGGLSLNTRMGAVHEQKPVSFQGNKSIETHFIIRNDEISFELENYDRSKVLVIDPPVDWSTYYGGASTDYIETIDVDASGNVYAGGQTSSTGNIATGGYQNSYGGGSEDLFLVKFNSSGVRQWATYYGGALRDVVGRVSVDATGNIYLSGTTSSFGLASGGFQNVLAGSSDGLLVKFDSNGALLWSTYYGGIDEDFGMSCTADGFGNVYLAGNTLSNNLATAGVHQMTPAGQEDGFIVKFDGNGVRLWASYFGGMGYDAARDCAADHLGNVFLVGAAGSQSGISYLGHQNIFGGSYNDGFVAKFGNSGTLQWASYYGGIDDDLVQSCATDPSGNICLLGTSSSGNNISTTNTLSASRSAFLAKFSGNGTRLWGSYVFGAINSITTYGHDCATDLAGNIYAAGYEENSLSKFTAVLNRYDGLGNFVDGVAVNGSLNAETGLAAATDVFGNLYFGGSTKSPNIASGGHQNSYGGGSNDGFLVKYLCTPPAIFINTLSDTVCIGEPVTVTAQPAAQYTWTGGLTGATVVITPTVSGYYTVTGVDSIGCKGEQKFFLSIIPCTDIDSHSQLNSQPLLFPNPSSAVFNLHLTHNTTAAVYNSIGQRISQHSYNRGSNEIDLSAHQPGVYLLVLEYDGVRHQVKMVRE